MGLAACRPERHTRKLWVACESPSEASTSILYRFAPVSGTHDTELMRPRKFTITVGSRQETKR
ncbi:hypothetical protein BaRGS_00037191, partial [Batillaria attramentaria]